MDDYIAKPIDAGALAEVMENYLAVESLLHSGGCFLEMKLPPNVSRINQRDAPSRCFVNCFGKTSDRRSLTPKSRWRPNKMLRVYYCCLLAPMALAQSGLPDPAFDKIPFDEWLNHADNAHMDWRLETSPAYLRSDLSLRLSECQRLEKTTLAIIEGREFVRRPKPGQMVLFIEIRDRDNGTYRVHEPLTLKKGTRPENLRQVRFPVHMRVLPGDYQVAAALYDTESQEHSLKRTTLHIPEIPHDPLPHAWRGLPNVEFSTCDSTNSVPLSLQLDASMPARIEVVVNKTFNLDKKTGAGRGGMLLPRAEIIAETEIRNGSMYVTVLDLARQRVNLTASPEERLFRKLLSNAMQYPLKIDDRPRGNPKEEAQFFVSEIRERLERPIPEARRVLIVLSAPLKFPRGEDLRPIQASPPLGTLVFYIRCKSIVPPPFMPPPQLPSPGDSRPAAISPPSGPEPFQYYANNSDSLEKTLKPLYPRVFDVTTALEFRDALAEIMSEIEQMK
jgi:hypothetical protein